MTDKAAIAMVLQEIGAASKKWPGWPSDPVHAAAVVSEEAGELVQAAMNHTYGWGDPKHMLNEAIQTAAVSIRFIIAHRSGHYIKNPDKLPVIK